METKEQYTPAEGSELSGPGQVRSPASLELFTSDLPEKTAKLWLDRTNSLGIDTETDGLLYRRDPLRLIQLADHDGNVLMVRNPTFRSRNLVRLLAGTDTAIFHHLMFDTGFIKWNLGFEFAPQQVECTKIAAKVLREPKSSLDKLIESYFDVSLVGLKEKTITKSDWNVPVLSPEQLRYAAIDVLYLHDLFGELLVATTDEQAESYGKAVQTALSKTYLEVEGYTDLLQYETDNNSPALKREWLQRARDMGI